MNATRTIRRWVLGTLAAGMVTAGGCGGGATNHMCKAPKSLGTEHNSRITADEVWTAAASPHVVTSDITIDSATLTVEPCAVVRIRKGLSIRIDGTSPTGALVAHGESIPNGSAAPTRRPITFRRDAADQPWGSLRVFPAGRLDFEIVDLTGGGDPDTAQSGGGMIVGAGEGNPSVITKNVRVVDVTIDGSAGFGVNMTVGAGFSDDSRDVVIRGAGAVPPASNVDTRFPIYVDGAAVSTVPTGVYTGNATDEIALANSGSLTSDVTFRARGVPYRMLGEFGMAPLTSAAQAGLSTLTIEPGVVIKIGPVVTTNVYSMTLGVSSGALPGEIRPVRLVAAGTVSAPIVLTSGQAAPAPGDWGGIEWRGGAATGNIMSNVRIEYAGGDSGSQGFGCGPGDNDAALIISNWRPDDSFIANCTFSDSAGGGIVSGWASMELGPILGFESTFTNIANGCNTSRWADANGSCPSPPPICF